MAAAPCQWNDLCNLNVLTHRLNQSVAQCVRFACMAKSVRFLCVPIKHTVSISESYAGFGVRDFAAASIGVPLISEAGCWN